MCNLMKICFLAPSDSAHTKKWCRYFVSRGHEVHVISFCDEEIEGVYLHYVSTGADINGGDAQKLKYILKARTVRRIVKSIRPDVINAHYATSYGVVAALAGLKNYVLSVWGSDIFVFPRKSFLHKTLLKFSLARADYLFSTSKAMAEEAAKYTKRSFEITPFGVNMELFLPAKRNRSDQNFVIGTVKTLAPDYGIDVLLKAIAMVKKEQPQIPLKLRIAGNGPCQDEYHALASELGIEDLTTWLGFIPQEQAAIEWANMDIAVVCSNNESFGVSAVEAQSSGCPVIISNIPGLMEATKPGVTSIVVSKGDVRSLADAVIDLYNDEALRKQMGAAGRAYVTENYEINACFHKVEMLYSNICK